MDRALHSVVKQTYENLDIIVVDDGSVDPIEGLVERIGDSRIRFFRKENGGAASARNFGLKKAHGQYIAFLDGDDLFFPEKIERMNNLLRDEGFPVCMATCGAYIFDKESRLVGKVIPESYQAGGIVNTSVIRPSCTMYHAEIFRALGGFPENMLSNEDGAFNSVATQYFAVICDSEPLVLYYQDEHGLARCYLGDYTTGVQVMHDRLAYVEQRVGADVYRVYRKRSYDDLLFGFLSAGNLTAAKKWNAQHADLLTERGGITSFIARLSLKVNMNIYYLLRKFRMGIVPLKKVPLELGIR